METDIRLFDVVESTNTTLEEMAAHGAPEGVCVLSLSQSKGQGRSGRSFYSPAGGNLYMSLLLRPRDQKSTDMITLTAAVAVHSAIKDEFGIDTGIKWVNDIIYNKRKAAGIVAKASGYGEEGMYVILGIGINIYESGDVPKDISLKYGTLTGKKCDLPGDEVKLLVTRLAKRIIDTFASYYEPQRFDAMIEEYKKYCIVSGKKVSYHAGDKKLSALCKGIDDEGGIVLDTDDGIRTFRDGEISISYDDTNLA